MPPYLFIQKVGYKHADDEHDAVDAERFERIHERLVQLGAAVSQLVPEPGEMLERPAHRVVFGDLKRHHERIEIDVYIHHQKMDDGYDGETEDKEILARLALCKFLFPAGGIARRLR